MAKYIVTSLWGNVMDNVFRDWRVIPCECQMPPPGNSEKDTHSTCLQFLPEMHMRILITRQQLTDQVRNKTTGLNFSKCHWCRRHRKTRNQPTLTCIILDHSHSFYIGWDIYTIANSTTSMTNVFESCTIYVNECLSLVNTQEITCK